MVRKHTRRAAKAAFAVSLGVALLIGLAVQVASAQKNATTSKPKIVIGTKNFAEEFILGQLYGQALAAKGFNVSYKNNIGSSEVIDTAFKSHKINFYPEYTGVIVLDLAKAKTPPKTAAATYQAAKTFEQQKRNATLLKPTPFYDSDTFTMLTKTAHKLGVKTIADMKGKPFSYAGLPECDKRITCILGFKTIYHLTHIKFVPLGTISVYTLLDQHKVTAGDGFSTDPAQLQHSKYTALTDTKHIFGFQNVAPVLSKALLKGSAGALLAKTSNAVSAKLSLAAMQAMNKAYYVNKQTAKQIAQTFLKANGLLK
jgi:osmoprotectant transport system substrate-binding protein